MKRTTWIILGVVVLLAIWLIGSYNGLVSARAGVDSSWAQVETQYQRRFDLVPNLVSTVKGAANFEQTTLENVTAARSAWAQAGQAGDRAGQITAAQGLDSSLSRLLVTVEAYPQLQATQTFRDLMTQLEGTENRISTARKDFNDSVMGYNVKVQRFPGNVAAGIFGFAPEKFFDSAAGAENAPTVDFGTSSSK